ncbi:MAG: redox-sensing transcriptional repressor Rex [Armatimonadetes bacterium RBG_16_58_9]|nr:MAG: redox-sensing transcriptional repressor Rex [Armatimonadetes bacterium RBG_16_58_9]
MPSVLKVPTPALERLATYYTILTDLKNRRVQTISSMEVEARTSINAAQFRKDLSYFGEFGRPGIGYDVKDLHAHIARILKVEKTQPVILVGAGNLGSALVGYPALQAENFHIVAAFDNNYNKIGKRLWDLTIHDISDIVELNEQLNARIGIIAVPASAGQEVAEKMVEANIKTILNFAPVVLKLPPHVIVRNVDFVQELAVLSFHLPKD